MLAQYNFALGIFILITSGITGAILILAPGSIRLQRPDCGWVGWAFNIMNLLFFLLIIPICGLMMMTGGEFPFLLCVNIPGGTIKIIIETLGLIFFLAGSLLLLWSRLSLRWSFRLGGVRPSQSDYLTMHGPYKHIRHPMYLSALLVLFGLTLILCSLLGALMFAFMLVLIQKLIPEEEKQLDQAYPMAYAEYCRRVPGKIWPRYR